MFDSIFNFLIFPEQTIYLFAIKWLFLVVMICFIVFSVYAFSVIRIFKLLFWYDFVEFFTLKLYGGRKAKKKWRKLVRKSKYLKPENYNFAIVKAHDILEILLERLAPVYSASTYGERLARVGEGTFSNIKDLWWAHELYRSVARNELIMISDDDFKKMMHVYNKAFKELEVL